MQGEFVVVSAVIYDKLALTLSPATLSHVAETLKTLLTIPVVDGHSLYLGLPTFTLQDKNLQFGYMKDRVLKRLHGWKVRLFSKGGGETLIKAVLQAILAYAIRGRNLLNLNVRAA